ncbi:hypothetical protein FRB94_005102 [Tulasnella sp. JGI-2019a]|nr:hypothetical protein FRB94_005102 [Tulasnella sp. JGI-2019a]KAG9032549.1 hypothetical protein FRB95_001214 [Tulasnella sp. JGI-2019a]
MRPELAHNIITFDGTLHPAPPKSQIPPVMLISSITHCNQQLSTRIQEQAFSETIVTSIRHMVNVKSITLHDFGWLGTPYENLVRDAISSTVSLSSLTTLIIGGQDFPKSGGHENHSSQLSLLLRSQPLLESLELGSGEWDLQNCILRSDVPRLSRLVARPHEARFLVPGRPITSLSITSIFTVPGPDEWKMLAASAVPLTFLTLDDTIDPEVLESALRSVATHFKDVQRLLIYGAAYHAFPLLVEGLPSFPSLRTLRLMAWDIDTEGKKKIDSRRLHAITCIRSVNPQFENLEIEEW